MHEKRCVSFRFLDYDDCFDKHACVSSKSRTSLRPRPPVETCFSRLLNAQESRKSEERFFVRAINRYYGRRSGLMVSALVP